MVRVNRNRERIFFKDRTDLATAVGFLLGCHANHELYIAPGDLALELDFEDLPCVSRAQIGYRMTLADLAGPSSSVPPPPPPPSPF